MGERTTVLALPKLARSGMTLRPNRTTDLPVSDEGMQWRFATRYLDPRAEHISAVNLSHVRIVHGTGMKHGFTCHDLIKAVKEDHPESILLDVGVLRALFLLPDARRFLAQDMTSTDIGRVLASTTMIRSDRRQASVPIVRWKRGSLVQDRTWANLSGSRTGVLILVP